MPGKAQARRQDMARKMLFFAPTTQRASPVKTPVNEAAAAAAAAAAKAAALRLRVSPHCVGLRARRPGKICWHQLWRLMWTFCNPTRTNKYTVVILTRI